jgi:hypothetical protein
MSASKTEPLEIHADTALFREALRFTAAETGFISRLIEKDYFCTLLLQQTLVAGLAFERERPAGARKRRDKARATA